MLDNDYIKANFSFLLVTMVYTLDMWATATYMISSVGLL